MAKFVVLPLGEVKVMSVLLWNVTLQVPRIEASHRVAMVPTGPLAGSVFHSITLSPGWLVLYMNRPKPEPSALLRIWTNTTLPAFQSTPLSPAPYGIEFSGTR